MSFPGQSLPGDDQVKADFLASRGAAAKGDDGWIRELAAGGNDVTPKASAPASSQNAGAPAATDQAQLPIGTRIENAIIGAGHAVKSSIENQASQSWEQMKRDWQAGKVASPNDSLWTLAKKNFDGMVAGGHLPVDAFNLVTSPFTGTLEAGTKAAGEGLHNLSPVESAEDYQKQLDTALLAVAPARGGSLLEGSAALAEAGGGEAATKAATAPKEAPIEPAPKEAAAAPAEAEPAASEPQATFSIEGKPGDTIKPTPEIRAQASSWLAGKTPDNPIQASLEHLGSEEAVNQTIESVARFIPKNEVKPDDILRMNAYSLNMSPDEVMGALKPKLPSDDLMGAAAMVINSSAEQVQKFAKVALETGAPEDNERFVRSFTQLNKVIGDWRDAGTDMGRAFRARQLAWNAHSEFSKQLQSVIENVGPDNLDELRVKIAALDDPRKVSPFVSCMRWMTSRDGLLYGWYNWLLSNPATIVKKIASDATVGAWNVAARYTAEKFGSGAIQPGETAALFHGYVGSMSDAVRAAGKALKAGESQFYGDYSTLEGETRTRLSALANGAPETLETQSPTRAGLHFLRSALPTSWIGAADDFAKVANYRAEARALAYREAAAKGLDGEDLETHISQTLANMPPRIHEQAVSAALKNTFQEPLDGLAASLQDTVDKINLRVPGTNVEFPLGRVVMPFVKVPANIARFAYRNSPLPVAFPSSAYRAELSAGGATRDLALARVGLGTAVSMIGIGLAASGMITGRGPADPQMQRAWRQAGYQPYSVRIGGNWYGYNKIEPIGMTLGTIADTSEIIGYAHEDDANALAWSMVFGAGNAMLSKTYMQGLSDFLEALHDPGYEGQKYANNLMATFAMPQGANALARSFDPWVRAHYGLIDAIANRTPGFSRTLPPMRDMWGDAVPYPHGFLPGLSDTGFARALSPVSVAPAENAQPIDKWIWDNRMDFPEGPDGRLGLSRPGQVESFSAGHGVSAQIQLTPQQLDRLRVLAGNELKDPSSGMGAKDTLNALVTGNHPNAALQSTWDKANPSIRALMVMKIWNQFRDGARQKLLKEDPNVQEAVGAGWQARQQKLSASPTMPDLGGGQ